MKPNSGPDLLLHNGRITTLDHGHPEAKNLAIKNGRIVGVDDAESYERGPETKVIDLRSRRVIPGLNDSHLHVIRAGLYYNLELRWDGTRVASYHPWTCLYWLTTGKTVGGTQVTTPENLLTREQALRLHTQGSAWFSGEAETKGTLVEGQFADLAVSSDDFLTCADEQVRRIESVLTVCDGKIVHAAGEFVAHNRPLPPVSPDWSPVGKYGGYTNAAPATHFHTPVFGADGRLWEMGCGCAV
jgi:hypothetical protein